MGAPRDFAREREEAEALLARDRFRAVEMLRGLWEESARARIGAEPTGGLLTAVRGAIARGIAPEVADEAASCLARAEEQEVIIGSWASGAGEGIASRFSSCTLKLARAWLLWAGAGAGVSLLVARTLAQQARAEPNGVGERLEQDVADVLRALEERAVAPSS